MVHSSADKRRVFPPTVRYLPVPKAHIRKSKKVREVIEQHRISFKPLIKDFGLNKVVDIVKILLGQRVFESELKAKIAFPELFQTSPARDVLRNESENDVACSAAETLEELTSASERGGLGNDQEGDYLLESKFTFIIIITKRVLAIESSFRADGLQRCKYYLLGPARVLSVFKSYSYANTAQAFSSYMGGGLNQIDIPNVQGFNSGSLLGAQYCSSTIRPSDETRHTSQTSFLNEAASQDLPNLKVFSLTISAPNGWAACPDFGLFWTGWWSRWAFKFGLAHPLGALPVVDAGQPRY